MEPVVLVISAYVLFIALLSPGSFADADRNTESSTAKVQVVRFKLLLLSSKLLKKDCPILGREMNLVA